MTDRPEELLGLLDAIERVERGTLPRDGKLVIDERPQGER